MDIETIDAADALARRHFSYLADPVGSDTWRSHADEALAGKHWQGDCDDLASTVQDILAREGLPLADSYRLLVSTTGAKTPNHMVATVRADNGLFRIIGDTFLPAYSSTSMMHRGLFYNRMSEVVPEAIWRVGVPWRADIA